MGNIVTDLVVRVRADMGSMQKDMEKGKGGIDSLVKGVFGGQLAFMAFNKAMDLVTGTISDWYQGAVQMEARQTAINGILTSGNHVMGLTMDQVTGLAARYSELTGIDDDVVMGAEGIIARYKQISDKTFPDVLKASLDLARQQASLNGTELDVTGTATKLALAMADPSKAYRLLRSEGVVLTAQQQESIKTFMKHGDVAKAQAVIMDGVKKSTHNAAEEFGQTNQGKIDKFKVSLDNWGKAMMANVLPVLGNLADFLRTNVPNAIHAAQTALKPLTDKLQEWGTQLKNNKPLLDGLKKAFEDLKPAIGPILIGLGALTLIGFAPLAILIAIVAAIVLGLHKLWEVTTPVRTAIGNLMGKLGELRDNLAQRLQPALHNISEKLAELHAWFNDKVLPVLKRVHDYFQANILPVLQQVGGFIRDQVVAHLKDLWDTIQKNVLPILAKLADVTKNNVGQQFKIFGDILGTVFNKIGDLIGKIGDLLGKLGQLKDALSKIHPPNLGDFNPFGHRAGGGLIPPGGEISWVGEHGPELLALPGGSRVIPAAQSAGLFGGSSSSSSFSSGSSAMPGGEVVVHAHLHMDGREVAQTLVRTARLHTGQRM